MNALIRDRDTVVGTHRVQLQALEQGGTRQQHHAGGDQADPGGRPDQPGAGAHVFTEDPDAPHGRAQRISQCDPRLEGTSRPASRAFCHRRNPSETVRISK